MIHILPKYQAARCSLICGHILRQYLYDPVQDLSIVSLSRCEMLLIGVKWPSYVTAPTDGRPNLLKVAIGVSFVTCIATSAKYNLYCSNSVIGFLHSAESPAGLFSLFGASVVVMGWVQNLQTPKFELSRIVSMAARGSLNWWVNDPGSSSDGGKKR